jgi:superfamily I DNA and/or RNA helicase
MLSFTNSLIKDEDTKEFEILNDKRRLTVAITRAKEKLILIGSISNLVRYKPLVSLISYMKEMDYVVNMSDLDFLKSIKI